MDCSHLTASRPNPSKKVSRCLTILKKEISELSATRQVKAITSQWGLSIRPQSLSFLLSKAHRSKRKTLDKNRSKRLDQRLNPLPDHSSILMPRLTAILTDLIPGDPTSIIPGLGIPPPPVLLATLEKLNHVDHRSSMFSSAATAATVAAKIAAAAHATHTSLHTTTSLQQHNNNTIDAEAEAKQRPRDPKHYKLIQDAREQQNKLRQGIVLLQSRVEECLDMVGRTRDDNNLALRLGHEAIQRKLETRKHELAKARTKISSASQMLWLIPILALEKLLKNGGTRNNTRQHVSTQDYQRNKKYQTKKFRRKAAAARGLTVGLNVPGYGRGLYYLNKDSDMDKKIDATDDTHVQSFFQRQSTEKSVLSAPMKKLQKKLSSLRVKQSNNVSAEDFSKNFLQPKKRRSNTSDRANGISLRMASSFQLSERLLRRFEFELLQEDRAVSQILCHVWLLSINYSHQKRTAVDPFAIPTVVRALENVLLQEKDEDKRTVLEDDLIVCWRLLTSSRVFRESQLRHVTIPKTKRKKIPQLPSSTGMRKKQRPHSAHAGSRRTKTTTASLLSADKDRERRKTIVHRRQRPSTASADRSSTPTSIPVLGALGRSSSTKILLLSNNMQMAEKQKQKRRRPQSAVQMGSSTRRWVVQDRNL